MATLPASHDGSEIKKVLCWPSPGCRGMCGLEVTVKEGQIEKIAGSHEKVGGRPLFEGCVERLPYLKRWLYHPDQLMHPLKRAGERGENKWEQVTWDQALTEIAEKLTVLKEKYGPETLAITEGTGRTDLYPIRTRFLSLFGSPFNLGDPGVICGCNKSNMRRTIMGTAAYRDNSSISKCLVIPGLNISASQHRKWAEILRRRQSGEDVRLIVIDPRETEAARYADLWLQLRPGTDAALYLAWTHVIIRDGLYDREFVEQWTVGFEKLKERVSQYTPEKVAEITWLPVEKIIESARLYAAGKPAYLGGGVASDEIGLNGIRVEQIKCCLRAITGNLRAQNGETPLGPSPLVGNETGIRDFTLGLEHMFNSDIKKRQIGSDRFKLMTWPAFDISKKSYRDTFGTDLSMSGHVVISNQPLIWRAILTGKPYQISAMITWSSNPLINAGNTKLVYKALKDPNLQLHVVLEHFMTPTALLADYVLPAASKLEKPTCSTIQDFVPMFQCAERAIQPLGERRSDYDFWAGLARKMGYGKYFPWETEEELGDYRLEPLGISFKEASTEKLYIRSREPWTYETPNPQTGKPTGFATPSGKVELCSSILEQLGYDGLPFYEEPPESPVRTPEVAKEYPYILTTGGRFRQFFHSEQRQIGAGFREQHPYPLMDIHPDTASKLGIKDGDWAYIETRRGVIKQKANITSGIDPRVINVESHWWFPEQPAQEPWLHGLWESNANVLTWDDPEICDPLTGGWVLRAMLCKVYKVVTPEEK